MKRITAALAAFFLALTIVSVPVSNGSGVALAMDRIQHLTGINPQSTWLNTEMRDTRLGVGTYWWNAFGSSTAYAGNYANCGAAPATGLYVAVTPTGASENCAVYQLAADDTSPYGGYPSGVGTYLPADSTQIVLQGLVPAGSSTANVGPMGVGSSSGQSIANLIECKVVTSDTTSQSVNIVSPSGAVSVTSANRDRVDRLSCQDKQSASATTPTVPTVDSGYVAISVVTVPFGTVTVTSGMIAASTGQAFYGFAPLSAAGATAIDTSSTNQTKAGGLTTGGLASVNGVSAGLSYTQTLAYGAGLNDTLVFNSGTGSGTTRLGASSGPTVAGVATSAFYIDNGDTSALVAVDASGDMGVLGAIDGASTLNLQPSSSANCISFQSGFSITCPVISNASDGGMNLSIADTSSNGYRFFTYATGSVLKENVAFPTSNGIQTDSTSNGTLSYVSPVYSSSGTAEPATTHDVIGFCTFSGTSCTSTLSGAAAYTSGSSYACKVNSGSTGVNVWTNSTSGTTVTLTAASSISASVTYVCTGY